MSLATLNLNCNSIKNAGADALFQFTKANSRIIKVEIDRNEVQLKFSKLIDQSCKSNYMALIKNRVPKIKNTIRRLKTTALEMEEVTERMNTQRSLKKLHTIRLRKQITRLNTLEGTETVKLSSLNDQLCKLRQASFQLSKDLDQLKSKYFSLNSKYSKDVKDMNSKIDAISSELKDLELCKKRMLKEQDCIKERADEEIAKEQEALEREVNSLNVTKMRLHAACERKNQLMQSPRKCKHR